MHTFRIIVSFPKCDANKNKLKVFGEIFSHIFKNCLADRHKHVHI